MRNLISSLRAHWGQWIFYFVFSLLVFVATLLSPQAANLFQLPDFLFVVLYPLCIFSIPVVWEILFGLNGGSKKRMGMMGISFCLMLHQAIGVNRLPEINHASMTILQCICFGLALQIGVWMNTPADRSGG